MQESECLLRSVPQDPHPASYRPPGTAAWNRMEIGGLFQSEIYGFYGSVRSPMELEAHRLPLPDEVRLRKRKQHLIIAEHFYNGGESPSTALRKIKISELIIPR